MDINLNTIVKVTLTREGMREWVEWNAQFRMAALPPPGEFIPEALEVPLWELMQIFGPKIYHGMPEVPFIDNKVEIINVQS